MTGYADEGNIGDRIRAARRARGFRTTRELADAIPGSRISEHVLENIEAGRKVDLPVSALLNLAKALRVPPPFLLVSLTDPSRGVDLPNLSDEVGAMSVAEFDAWLAGDSAGAYRPASPDERNDLVELEAFRELQRLRRELDRESAISQVEASPTGRNRIDYLQTQTVELTKFLTSAGWKLDD